MDADTLQTKVARAMAEANSQDPDATAWVDGEWRICWQAHIPAASAALAVVLAEQAKVTPAMIAAARAAVSGPALREDVAVEIFSAMLDAFAPGRDDVGAQW